MRALKFLLAAGLIGGLAWPATAQAGCAKHGTQVEFVDTPKEAAEQAKKEEKLVFVLHVSGLFEDPKLT
jgi:hypothetical protein